MIQDTCSAHHTHAYFWDSWEQALYTSVKKSAVTERAPCGIPWTVVRALPRVLWSYSLSTDMLAQTRKAFSIRSHRKKLSGFLCLNSSANFPFLFVSTHLTFDNSSLAGQFILGLKLLLFCLESLKNQPFARRCLVSLLSTEKPLTPFRYFENRFQTCDDCWFG